MGFWPGNRDAPQPIFYACAYPTPDGYSAATIEPAQARRLADLGEFALPYDAVATADDPDATLLSFFDIVHTVAADLAHWDQDGLACARPEGPDWWRNRPHPHP